MRTIEEIKKSKKVGRERVWGGLVPILEDMENFISQGLLDEITEMHEEGYEPEEIAKAYRYQLDPDWVFIVLFHQARKGKIKRPFAFRFQNNTI